MEKENTRIIAIGDVHGRTIWEEIVEKEESSDKFIFVGDYFDTHYDVTGKEQIDNFKKIIEFKKNNMDKVVLLIGNHDYHYIKGTFASYSSYQPIYATEIGGLLDSALSENLMQMCFVHNKYVFTHAGVTKTWATANNIDVNNLEASINDLFRTKPLSFGFTRGRNYSPTGDDITQTPIWVRLPSLHRDALDDVIYVVGHTTHANINITGTYIAIDTLGTSGEYLIIENNLVSIGK